jgi:aspartokinase
VTHDIVVTEGYIARSSTGQATTMGRESSNYSATLLGGMLGADSVRIYTGVPGILTADPALLSEARTIPKMSYGMANTLAELGAKVLHPRTVMPVERGRIPLVITRIGGESTTIGVAGESGCSVALLPEAGLISVDTTTAGIRIGPFIRAIGAEAPVIWYQRFRRRLQILVAHGYPSTRLPVHQIGEPAHAESADVSIVSVVQERMFNGRELERFFAAIGERRPLALQGGIGRHAISIAIDRDVALDVARELHRRFVEHVEEAEGWPSHSA